MKRKRIMGFFLALVMFIGCLPLNPIASYANGDVEINEKNFPDENFRDFIDFFIDEDNNGFLNHEELDQIDQLPLNGGSIKFTNLKGIEYFKNLKILNCAGNELEYLDVSHNPKLTELDCSNNKLTRLNVSHNPELTKLNCRNNNLTSLDVRNSPNLTEFWCGNQQYDITVNGLGEFKYSNFPGSFDLRRVIINSGATYRPKYLQLWDNDIKEVTYRYRANDDREMYVKLNVHRKFDPDYVESMIVKTQPTKLSYTEGDRLDLTRLVVTLKDKQGLKEEAKLEEFTRYGIKTDPENRANLTLNNNNKPVTIRKGNAQCETDKLIVKAKVVVPDPANPGQVPTGRVRVTFDAGDGNTIDGNRYKVIDVLTGTKWDNAKVKEQIPASATYKDNTKVFDKWDSTVPTTGTVEAKTFTAVYKAKELVKTGTDPKATTPDGYTRITFDATTDGNINGQRYKVIDVLNGTEWNNEAVKGQIPESAKYKDNTKVFDKWSETVPTTGTVEAKTFTANYKVKELVKIGTDPKAQVPDGYTRVTFDAGEGNTIDRTNNRYKVIDVLTGTAWDNSAVKGQIPASATYKDNTKEFKEWDSTVPDTGEVEEQDFTAVYKVVPAVVGPVDPTDPNGGKPADTSKYWTVTFKSEDETKGTVDAKNTVYVLKTENKTLADITAPKVTAKAGFKFTGWEPALDANTTINKDMTVNAKFEKVTATPTPQDPSVVVGPVDPTDSNDGKPADTSKYWTVTFVSEDQTKGAVAAKNTVYVLKTAHKTLADITAPKATAKAGFKFTGWEPALDANTTINKDMTVKAYFKASGTTPTDSPVVGPVDPTDPNGGKPADTSKYWTVTFKSEDETKGTVDAKNTVYVLKTETKTLADITAPKVTAKAGYEFDKWEPALDANTTINKDMIVKAYFKQAGTPIPQDPPVVRTADTNTKKIQVANNRKLPKTANSMNIELYTFFMILSAALLVVAFKRKKSQ